eukprot:TRINITY_DN6125_c0_g1_i1.p1 TRINITY_DN6125_c0_g1~~TRINITY_DN6125_c0_g1_i1.p1  ORF type:complete len:253 (+),score=38.93 TRINITY_DN6125_c0_g1_i1:15-773(+)
MSNVPLFDMNEDQKSVAVSGQSEADRLLSSLCYPSITKALTSKYAIISATFVGSINFLLNWGIIASINNSSHFTIDGLWQVDDLPGETPYSMPMVQDMFITMALVVFFTGLLSGGGVRDKLKKGECFPISDAQLENSWWRLFPVRLANDWSRLFLTTFEMIIIYYGVTLLFLAFICACGGMGGYGHACTMNATGYAIFKGFWVGISGALTWQVIFLGMVNLENLPMDVKDAVEEFHKKMDNSSTSSLRRNAQ